ncbi:MAG TPA: T9SS type A sorting domain-containing protein, partial [Cytophagaceae bacterium]
TSYNGVKRNGLARLNNDGSLDTSFDPGIGANNWINSIALESDGKIIIAGSFTSYNGTPRNNIAKLSADGSLDNTFDPGIGANDEINDVKIQNDGNIIIGGYFTSYGGIGRNRVARILNATGTASTNMALSENKVAFYPNPSTGYVTVSSSVLEGNIEFYTIAGVPVYSTRLTMNTTTLDLQGMQPGLYIVKVLHANGTSVGKLVLE